MNYLILVPVAGVIIGFMLHRRNRDRWCFESYSDNSPFRWIEILQIASPNLVSMPRRKANA